MLDLLNPRLTVYVLSFVHSVPKYICTKPPTYHTSPIVSSAVKMNITESNAHKRRSSEAGDYEQIWEISRRGWTRGSSHICYEKRWSRRRYKNVITTASVFWQCVKCVVDFVLRFNIQSLNYVIEWWLCLRAAIAQNWKLFSLLKNIFPYSRRDFSIKLTGVGSYLHLYNVNFTNTVEGGSSFCFPCYGSGCMECAQGIVVQ